MKTILTTLLLLLYTATFAADVYIDPTNSKPNRNGTIDNPYATWQEIKWQSNNNYLFKAGTTFTGNYFMVRVPISNVTISRYGRGQNPIIVNSGTGKTLDFTSDIQNLTIKHIEITSTNYASSLINFSGSGANIVIQDCYLHKAQFTVRIRSLQGYGFTNVKLLRNIFRDSKDDNVYIYGVTYLTVADNKFEKANQNWYQGASQKVAAGDGLQIILSHNVEILRNFIDRSTTGNKFCLIMSGGGGTILISNNIFLAPIQTSEGGAAVYLYDLPTRVQFENNRVTGSLVGVVYQSAGVLYSERNTYTNNVRAISHMRPKTSQVYSVGDTFTNCKSTVSPTVVVN